MFYNEYIIFTIYVINISSLLLCLLFIRAFASNPKKKSDKEWNNWSVLEKKNLAKHNNPNMFKYFVILDAPHFVWENEVHGQTIIDQINHY